MVGEVMDHENKGAHAMHLVAPAESEKGKGGEMVDEHLPEVFPLHVGELGDKEGPVKSHLEHVVPPNGWVCEKKNYEIWVEMGLWVVWLFTSFMFSSILT